MERNIFVLVKDKVAYAPKDAVIVCNNRDYTITFDFDDEWAGINAKTARFVANGKYTDVVFTGNSVNAPPVCNAAYVNIGVFATDIATTYTSIRCDKSILCEGGTVADSPPDVYAQILDLLNQIEGNQVTDEEIEAAVTKYLTENPVKISTDESLSYKDGTLSVNMEKIIEQLPLYEGEYVVIPSVEDQKLLTAQKLMNTNLKIEKIPYAEVTNAANGVTATIG